MEEKDHQDADSYRGGPQGSRHLPRAKPLLISRKRNQFASGFKIKLGGIIKVFKTN